VIKLDCKIRISKTIAGGRTYFGCNISLPDLAGGVTTPSATGAVANAMKFTPQAEFAFITDTSVRQLIEDYHRQAVSAFDAGAYLGTLVSCGGVLEGVLGWVLLSNGVARIGKIGKEKPVEECFLPELIEAAVQRGLLGETAETSTWAVKEFRNFLHPYKLIRQQTSARPDQSLALNSLSAVDEVVRSIRSRLGRKEGRASNV
jgi:hypothetical protein